MPSKKYVTKDSGKRVDFESGMRRDTDKDKPRYDLIPLEPLRRLAELYARGAVKYGDRNWELANSPEELARFKASCLRHLYQWLAGEDDEDHAIAAVWNIFAALTVQEKLVGKSAFEQLEEIMRAQVIDVPKELLMAPDSIIADLVDEEDDLNEPYDAPKLRKKGTLREKGEHYEGPVYHEKVKDGNI